MGSFLSRLWSLVRSKPSQEEEKDEEEQEQQPPPPQLLGFFNHTHISERDGDENKEMNLVARRSDGKDWPGLCRAFEAELLRYNEQNLLELYTLIELACVEKWHQTFIDTMVGRFFTLLRLQAREYFKHDPTAAPHPVAGPWPNILYVTYWLNFCQVRDFSKLASLPLWFPKYPQECMYIADVVCNNKKALNRVSTVWQQAFVEFHNKEPNPLIEVFVWWAESWLIPAWCKHLRKKAQ